MKKFSRALVFAMAVVLAFAGMACNGVFNPPTGDPVYNRYPTDYDPDVDSWEQVDPGDEDVSIKWFLDYSQSDQNLSDLIYKRTGVRVQFQYAMTDDHSELNTMISGGGRLPDVISIEDTSLRIQLAEEGYCYAIDKLAESYAPSLLKRISPEHADYYRGTDGNVYALASNFYNDSDIDEFEEIGGKQYPNIDIIVRKDYINAYIDAMQSEDPSFDADKTITKPSGFLDMCRWVKNTYGLSNTTPTVCLMPFRTAAVNDIINYSLQSLMEFMGVPLEDEEGNYLYWYDTPEFLEVIDFMNTLYSEKLVISANFDWSFDNIYTQILNGKPFAMIGASQTVIAQLGKYEMDGYNAAADTVAAGNEYVPIVLTNEEGDAPLLMDYAGRGLRSVMVTRNCTREDRVIKVIDYMMSEQGMREMQFGETEGEYYDFTVRPGEINPKNGKESTYGVIELTEKGKSVVSNAYNQSLVTLGLNRISPLVNAMYLRIVSESDDYAGIMTPWNWIEYKNKSAYFNYTYSRVPFRYPLDVSDRYALNDYTDRQAAGEQVWIEALPKMIKAATKEEMRREYDAALKLSYEKGAAEWTEFRNKCFKAYKEKLGIEFAWPKNDSAYKAPEVKLFGFSENTIQRPPYVYRQP